MKFLSKLDKKTRFRLEVILKKILENNFDWLKIQPLSWKNWYFKVRVWKIRIIFIRSSEENIIDTIWYRWDVYKWL
jgi:mRNA-degrading endonuclease RelE of RelBE toxin-antitoxin system